MPTSNKTRKWVEQLAKQELSILSGDRASVDLAKTKEELLKQETHEFMMELAEHFSTLVEHFNALTEESAPKVEFRSVGDSFYLRRAGRLLSARKAVSGINLCCEKLTAGDGARGMLLFSSQVEARFGEFFEVRWSLLNVTVTSEQVARQVFTEFVQASRL